MGEEERRDHSPLRQWEPIPGHRWRYPEGLGMVNSCGSSHPEVLDPGAQSWVLLRPGVFGMRAQNRTVSPGTPSPTRDSWARRSPMVKSAHMLTPRPPFCPAELNLLLGGEWQVQVEVAGALGISHIFHE